MMCVAQYSADKMWYRAEVIDIISSGQIAVKYVDYGNTEITSVWNLRKLLDVYTVLPVQVICCVVSQVCYITKVYYRIIYMYRCHWCTILVNN